MPGGREIYSEWSLIYQLSPGYILLCGHSELIMLRPVYGRVISRVLMVRARVCHWLMTIKSPLIWADHCWLWAQLLSSHPGCPVSSAGVRSPQPARARPGPGHSQHWAARPGAPSPLSADTLATLESTLLTLHTSHSPWNSLGCQPLPSSRPPLPLSWTGLGAERDE